MNPNDLKQEFVDELSKVRTSEQLKDMRVRYLGRKGKLNQWRQGISFGSLSAEERKKFGESFQELKAFFEAELSSASVTPDAGQKKGKALIDVTLPGTGDTLGCLHPISLIQMELENILQSMGFSILSGTHVVTEHYNFDALNIPSDHPARDMQDTYWLTNSMLLRTHTSAMQVKALEEHGAPFRAVFPGRCFRHEAVDASHENTFYQMEGLMVDKDISIAHLIGTMNVLLSRVFHRKVVTRLRPGFFPFVEPGFELDIQCLICGGSGCATCKGGGWVELLPCGLVHPRVLQNAGIDEHAFSGFAFGLGLTRLAMMKFGIPEIRLFNSGDLRFYEQFPAGV